MVSPDGVTAVHQTGRSPNRLLAFISCVLAAYLVPSLVPGLGISYLSTFTVGLILFAWVALKWGTLTSLSAHSRHWEVLLGGAIVAADFVRNIVLRSAVGLTDMLFIFVGIWIAFYGFRNLRLFILPTLYVSILIVGYLAEYHIPSVAGLEYFIAGTMTWMLHGIGAKATVFQNTVTLYAPSPVFLQVDGPCTGLQGILAFGLLASMAVLDVRTSPRRLALVMVIGFAGAFLINFVRLALIFLSFQFLGAGIGGEVHAYMGYLLFLAWVLVFWDVAFRYLTKGQVTITSLGPK